MRSIIFDLDLTLVDTSVVEEARHRKDWSLAYSLIPNCNLYDGMEKVFEVIKTNHIKIAIVSTSPKPYIERVCNHFQIPYNVILGYHDCKPVKPHPAGMLKALEYLQEPVENVISFGDRVIDIHASNAAGIESVACFWGSKEKARLLHSGYSHAIIRPNEILTLIR